MIIGKNVTKSFYAEPILDDITFKLGNNRKIGIVGKNGCGKTTLFKLIAGMDELTSGHIDISDEVIGYVPQEFIFPDLLVGEYLEKLLTHQWEFYKFEILAKELEFHNFDVYQNITTLSEGQKMKLKLMEVLIKDSTTILVDEPTNHLDIEGILWFENYIKRLAKTVVMISHDREFLNNTVDEVWEIENKKILMFVGNYDTYKEGKLKLIDKWNEEYVRFLKKKDQLETLLKNARRIGGKQGGRAVKAAKKRIEREVDNNKKEKYVEKKIQSVEFDTDIRASKLIVRFENVAKSYGAKDVFKNLDFEIRGKEKVWLFGPNGAGKTTLVKLIMGEEQQDAGDITIGDNLKIGYFAQRQTHLDFEETVYEHFIQVTKCTPGEAFGLLKRFLFEKDALKKKIKNLSPGERARFAFAIFAQKNYDLLILDEPTNHLDIETKEVIEKSLNEFAGTLLLVSHDRYFVESVGIDKILNLKEGSLTLY